MEIRRSAEHEGNEQVIALVDRIRDTLDSAVDPRGALAKVFTVQGLDQAALRLLWLLDKGRVDGGWPNHDVVLCHAQRIAEDLSRLFSECPKTLSRATEPDMRAELLAFSAQIEMLKRDSTPSVRRATVHAIKEIAQRVAPLLRRGSPQAEVAEECIAFIEWAQKHRVETDDKTVAILHTAHVTLQTSLEVGEGECEENISRTLEILRNPERVFGIHLLHTSEIYG